MKKRFTDEQIIGFLHAVESGLSIEELCRRRGFPETSYSIWRNKFGGMRGAGAMLLMLLLQVTISISP